MKLKYLSFYKPGQHKANITSNTLKLREKSIEDDKSGLSSVSYACQNASEPNVSKIERKKQDEESTGPRLHNRGEAYNVNLDSLLSLNRSSISL